MILATHEYNPLPEIFRILPYHKENVTPGVLDFIQRELFKGGVVAETSEEFEELLIKLIELKKEFNGKS